MFVYLGIPVNYIGESAVTVLLQLFFDSNDKVVSDSEIRYPSHVDDIASVCVNLLELKQTSADVKGFIYLLKTHKMVLLTILHLNSGIYHWGGIEFQL